MPLPMNMGASILLLLSLSISLFGCATHRPSSVNAQQEIRSVLQKQVEAWNRGDLEGFMEGYSKSPETRFASGGSIQTGWENVFNRYKAKYGNRELMGALSFSDVEITMLSKDTALAFGRWKLLRQQDQPSGLFTLVFRNSPHGWRITHDHTSSTGS